MRGTSTKRLSPWLGITPVACPTHGAMGPLDLETMLDDGLLPATLVRHPLLTICSGNPVQQEVEILEVGKRDDRCNHGHRSVQ